MRFIILFYLFTIVFIEESLSQESALEESMERGSEIYADFCVTCHLDNGEGVPYAFPPLAKSDYLANNRLLSINALKYGLQGEIMVNGITYNSAMAPLGLEDQEIADVMNFIMNSWGNTQNKIVTEAEVTAIER